MSATVTGGHEPPRQTIVEESRRRVALLLEYDGSRYAGSQYQRNAPTVQAVLEDAIERATGCRLRAAFAGRTDAGVHALGQVASFLTGSRLALDALQRALNAWLPREVAVRAVAEVAPAFDVRRAARRRHYRYLIDNRRVRPALERGRVWHIPRPLDVASMAEAAAGVTGHRDFGAFASAPDRPGSTERTLYCFTVRRQDERVTVDAVANAFLPHQVRRMVGALVDVGLGRRSVAEYEGLLFAAPAVAGPSAPAHALYLVGVDYGRPLFGENDSLVSELRV